MRRISVLLLMVVIACSLYAQGYKGGDYGNCYYAEIIDTSDRYETECDIVKYLYEKLTDQGFWDGPYINTKVEVSTKEFEEEGDAAIFSVMLIANLGDYSVRTMLAIGGSEEDESLVVNITDCTEGKEKYKKKQYRLSYDSWVDELLDNIYGSIRASDNQYR